MEDVVDVCARPPGPARPVVSVDEGGKQLVGDVREPLAVLPDASAKQDEEYARGGIANPFMAFEPHYGTRTSRWPGVWPASTSPSSPAPWLRWN
jgi:hypothetical protein